MPMIEPLSFNFEVRQQDDHVFRVGVEGFPVVNGSVRHAILAGVRVIDAGARSSSLAALRLPRHPARGAPEGTCQ